MLSFSGNFSGKEKRQYPRTPDSFIAIYRLVLPLPVLMKMDAEEYPAVAMDLSEVGMSLDVDQELLVGAIVSLRFELINSRQTAMGFHDRLFRLEGEIRHCTMRDQQLYRIGILFKQTTPEERVFIATYIKDLSLKENSIEFDASAEGNQ